MLMSTSDDKVAFSIMQDTDHNLVTYIALLRECDLQEIVHKALMSREPEADTLHRLIVNNNTCRGYLAALSPHIPKAWRRAAHDVAVQEGLLEVYNRAMPLAAAANNARPPSGEMVQLPLASGQHGRDHESSLVRCRAANF